MRFEFDSHPVSLVLLITVPSLDGDESWTWKCEGDQHFVVQAPGKTVGFIEEPDFEIRPLYLGAHSICCLRRVWFEGMEQIVSRCSVVLTPQGDPFPVAFPTFTKDNPLELTFSHAPEGASVALHLDPLFAEKRIAELLGDRR